MKLLLDTHTFLWFIWADSQLSEHAREAISQDSAQCVLSTASLWEICVKVSLGKLTVLQPFEKLVEEHVLANGIEIISMNATHLDVMVDLPFHHRDPFDRLILAQAIQEQATIVSKDSKLKLYNVELLW